MRRATTALVAAMWLLQAGTTAAQELKAGDITVLAPWARATPGGATVGAAFLEVRIAAGAEDKLTGARSPGAGSVELHDHISEGGVMRMRRVEAIPITGAQAVVLKPGGLHFMLMDLKAPLRPGGEVELTLVFEKAGELNVRVPIGPIGAAGPGGSGSGSGSEAGSGSGSGR